MHALCIRRDEPFLQPRVFSVSRGYAHWRLYTACPQDATPFNVVQTIEANATFSVRDGKALSLARHVWSCSRIHNCQAHMQAPDIAPSSIWRYTLGQCALLPFYIPVFPFHTGKTYLNFPSRMTFKRTRDVTMTDLCCAFVTERSARH